MSTSSPNRAVYLLATLDTKGEEAAYLRDQLVRRGIAVKIVDTGCIGTPSVKGDITREELFKIAGSSLLAVQQKGDRGEAVSVAARGAEILIQQLHAENQVAGVISMGGSAGTTIGTAAMRALPLGVPKVMISTHASGNTRGYVGHKDIVMVNPIVDISGLNRISRTVLTQGASVMAGLVTFGSVAPSEESRPVVAATMFGVTTPCVEHARGILEAAGFEVLVFHATGSGGQAMESLLADGAIAGVLDMTTTEIADELCGGFLSAGPERLTTAGARGIPQVISVGATDMVNFYGIDTVPVSFRERKLYKHNEHVTLMRSTAEENRRIGETIAKRAKLAKGPVAIFLPNLGVSAIDRQGQPFDDPTARQALFDAIDCEGKGLEIVQLEHHINDNAFAEQAANRLIQMMRQQPAG